MVAGGKDFECKDGFPDDMLVGDLDEGLRLNEKGLALMGKGKYGQAIPWFEKVHHAAPFVPAASNNWALCLMAKANLDKAFRVQKEGLADRSGFAQDVGLSFYTGVAAANLGKRARALADLGRVAPSHPKADTARRYLEHLREKSDPHTVRGDWPYLHPHEVCPFDVVKAEGKDDNAPWFARRIAAQLCEAILNESADNPDNVLQVLSMVKHPDATDLLWTIVKGSFGSDELRMGALVALQNRGEVRHNQKLEILQDGKRTTIATMGTQLNPDLQNLLISGMATRISVSTV